MIPAKKSIEYRPKEAESRMVYGYWEGVVGKQCIKTVLFTLTERMTRQEIIMKLPNKETATISKAFDKLERKIEHQYIMHIHIVQVNEEQMRIIID